MPYSGKPGFRVLLFAGLTAACCVTGLVGQASAQVALDSLEGRGSIRQMQRLSAGEGWALTDTALLFTHDAGANWTNLISGHRLEEVSTAFFLSPSKAWLAGVESSRLDRLVLLDSTDRGASWRRREIEMSALPSGQTYARARAYFLDAFRGWLQGEVATSSAFSLAELLRTQDGGASWVRLPPPPSAGNFVFVDSDHGYLRGAPVSEMLYRTLDGGRHWKEVDLPLPVEKGMALLDLPTFHTPASGTLAVTIRGDSPRVLSFVTHDGGENWRPAASTPLPPGDYDEPVPIALDRNGSVLAVACQGMVALMDGADHRVRPLVQKSFTGSPDGSPHLASARALALTEDSSAWVLVAEGGCEETMCRQVGRLVAVRASDSPDTGEDLLVRIREEQRLRKEPEIGAKSAAISVAMGFDKCAAGTAEQMQTWWDHSPYMDANIYFGGSARACSQVNLNAEWVVAVFDQGWRLIPTWVGPQAPCTRFSRRFSSDPIEARADGLTEADSAVATAAVLGLGAGTPLYYDFEYYDENDESCSAAVSAFIDAWTERVNDLGYLSGAYGNARNVQNDWVPGVIANPPDAVWLVPWVCGRTTSCDWTPTTFGVPGLDDSYWADYQRIRQYWGPHTETYGGVTFEIDGDYAGGPVAVAEASSSCWEIVAEDRWQGEYFDNTTLSGSPSMIRDDGAGILDFDWGHESPSPSCDVPSGGFSARWTREVNFDAGTYRFTVTGGEGLRLVVDDVLVLDDWEARSQPASHISLPLTAGNHVILFEYFEETGEAEAGLSWERIATFRRGRPNARYTAGER